MAYELSRQQSHTHRYFADVEDPTKLPVCICGKEQGKRKAPRGNKFNARTTEYNGLTYDSGKEARHAAELDLLKKAGKILGYDRQYPVEVSPEDKHLFTTKVDFRVHLPNGSYALHEIKSWITARRPDYRLKRKCIELYWLPKHPDTTYHEIQ
jgi:hypothetical protein